MSQDAKVAPFVSRLNSPMEMHLQLLQLTTFQYVQDAGKLVEQEVLKNGPKENRTQSKENQNLDYTNCIQKANNSVQSKEKIALRLPFSLCKKTKHEFLCLGCLDPNHQISNCPSITPNTTPQTRTNFYHPNTKRNGGSNTRYNGGNGRFNCTKNGGNNPRTF